MLTMDFYDLVSVLTFSCLRAPIAIRPLTNTLRIRRALKCVYQPTVSGGGTTTSRMVTPST